MNNNNNNNTSIDSSAEILRLLAFIINSRRNANLTNVELLLNQISKQDLILQQQIERSRQQLLDCAANIMIESLQLVSCDYFFMIYTCRSHSFTLERGPQEVNHVRYGVFRQWWYVRHPTLTDDLGSNSFQLQYQMSRANFELLLNIVSQHQVYEAVLNNNSYPIEIQVATVLWRFANTHFGYHLTEQFLGVSAGSYTRFTMRFITAMSDYSDKFVNWGVHDSETAARRAAEFEQPERRGVRLPGVIGAIDGKLISIQKPSLHGNS
ncbi:hypothetical protein J3Q64DRAFT_1881754 [Phycomyces blakesleeanus]|uniref:DDE Tnp4 domain-containing protein n=2 Tax=Phycomyces blakesleeanus TaxID=4837 RepID=A0A167MWQ0_PHYB8|nr:hypothetical protein PHYBLDRAFT_167720 [Phycomyces blakesleeanus NRRL 1555(-)]OAD74304.1 hypothetical protein PHYBLDRAFT_167720 [Phycomyces blakesleeanus NRRL 1555(-)]|eukprot:XP_018292344.1 hypothetical protein PHYBLDRAFT_167720 [Phycomyces blakesleeanus NRRL 1555(-)]